MSIQQLSETVQESCAPSAGVVYANCKQTELGPLPSDWNVLQLRDGVRLKSGHHVLAQHCNLEGRGTPYLTGPADFPAGVIRQTKYVTKPSSLCNKGDILVTVKGSGAGKVVRSDRVYCISRQLMAVEVVHWSSDYVEHAIRYSSTISAAAAGLIPGLSREDILSTRIAVPSSIKEQIRIAEALADSDAAVVSLEKIIEKKRLIQQGAMQELLSGHRRLPSFTGEWNEVPLASLGEVLNGLTYSPSAIADGGTLVLRSSNIQNDSLAFENNVFVKMDIPPQSMVKPNDLLICVRNGSRDLIGKVAKIDERCIGMAFGAFMTVFRTDLHDFLLHKFRSKEIKKQISERLGATINQITNGDLRSFRVSVPPTKMEAAEIGHTLREMDNEIALLNQQLSKAKMIKQGMMQKLLTGRVRLV